MRFERVSQGHCDICLLLYFHYEVRSLEKSDTWVESTEARFLMSLKGEKPEERPSNYCWRQPTRLRFSVSFSQRLILQIWWDLMFLHGAQAPQFSFRAHPVQSPQRFRFFLPDRSQPSPPWAACWWSAAVDDTAGTCTENMYDVCCICHPCIPCNATELSRILENPCATNMMASTEALCWF